MTTAQTTELKAARAVRLRRIRARVIAGSVALFLIVWGVIGVTLITGNDPALARKAVVRPASTSASSGAGSTAQTGSTASSGAAGPASSTGAGGFSGPGSSTATGGSGPSAVATQQS